jgi:hypothetical protein
MGDLERNRKVLEWLWKQIHKDSPEMPPDRLIFEGDHDLIYLYRIGMIDTDRYSLEKWLQAFRESRQKGGSYSLTLQQWLDKAPYRYSGPVQPAFDPMTIRDGDWTEEEWKQLVKDKFLPETTVPFEMFLYGIAEGKKKGLIKDGIITMTSDRKKTFLGIFNKHPSPRRCRALAIEKVQQKVREHEEFESGRPKTTQTRPAPVAGQPKTKYEDTPDQQKQSAGKLSDLLSGSKK